MSDILWLPLVQRACVGLVQSIENTDGAVGQSVCLVLIPLIRAAQEVQRRDLDDQTGGEVGMELGLALTHIQAALDRAIEGKEIEGRVNEDR